MKSLLVFIFLYSNAVFAVSVFGDKIKGDKLLGGAEDCAATELVRDAITNTGVNFIDSNDLAVWNCKCENGLGKCDGGSVSSRSLLNNCRGDYSIRCFSRDRKKFSPAVCVSSPRSEAVTKKYHSGVQTHYRPRFDRLYTIHTSPGGFTKDKSWKMDSNGCNPEKADLDGPFIGDFKECKSKVRSFVKGGFMMDPKISTDKFCDGKMDSGKINSIKALAACFDAYPQLKDIDTYKKSLTRNKSKAANK